MYIWTNEYNLFKLKFLLNIRLDPRKQNSPSNVYTHHSPKHLRHMLIPSPPIIVPEKIHITSNKLHFGQVDV